MRWWLLLAFAVITISFGLSACFAVRPSMGGGEGPMRAPPVVAAAAHPGDTKTKVAAGARALDKADVRVPDGYEIDPIATGFTFPTGVAFDDDGTPFVLESGYAYGEVFAPARLLRVGVEGVEVVARSDEDHGWMGLDWSSDEQAFYVADAGITRPGRILRIDVHGVIDVVVDGLPSLGDHHVNGPALKDGWVYFGVGSATNAGVVGTDNHDFGWLARAPDFHDIPCADVSLRGINARTPDPLTPDVAEDVAVTGAFLPFGTPSARGQIVRGRVPCTGAVLRAPMLAARATGATRATQNERLEVVAWGFRNPFGLAFHDDGRLFVTDNGADERGSRPIYGAADMLWEVKEGTWYGWPDYVDGRSVASPRYAREGQPMPVPLLVDMPPPPRPAALFAVHSSSNGFAFSTSARFGHVGEAFVAQFGDQAPVVGKTWAPVGFKVVRVDVATGIVRDFAVNNSQHQGPSSLRGLRGLERPIAARFDPDGAALYVVDFGVMKMDEDGAHPIAGTGALWRIARAEDLLAAGGTPR